MYSAILTAMIITIILNTFLWSVRHAVPISCIRDAVYHCDWLTDRTITNFGFDFAACSVSTLSRQITETHRKVFGAETIHSELRDYYSAVETVILKYREFHHRRYVTSNQLVVWNLRVHLETAINSASIYVRNADFATKHSANFSQKFASRKMCSKSLLQLLIKPLHWSWLRLE